MAVTYKDEGMQVPVECLLSAIDFDAEILTLTPIDPAFHQDEFKANLKFISIPKRMKVVSINGEKIVDPISNFIKGRKYP